jgi:hypothetical protein
MASPASLKLLWISPASQIPPAAFSDSCPPEAYHHFTQHPNWTLQKEIREREGRELETEEGAGLMILKNAFVERVQSALDS